MNSQPNNTPSISVIMPIYNAEQYIDAAIESVINQTFADFELLLLNDGSTDGSLARLEHFAAIDSRCKIFSSENKGIVLTLNSGIELAQAEVICRMDADDICRPQRFEKQFQYLKDHPHCVAVGSKVLLIDSEGLPIINMFEFTEHDAIDMANLSESGSYMCHPATILRKYAILKVGGYRQDYHYAEDLDLFLRLAEVGKLSNLPEVLFEYRQHVKSVGYANRVLQFKATHLAVIDARKRRGIHVNMALNKADITELAAPTVKEIHMKWAWWALLGDHIITAKKHAFKAFIKNPLSLDLIKLFYCLYIKQLTKKPD